MRPEVYEKASWLRRHLYDRLFSWDRDNNLIGWLNDRDIEVHNADKFHDEFISLILKGIERLKIDLGGF